LQVAVNDIQMAAGRQKSRFAMGMPVGTFPIAHIHRPDIEIVVHILCRSGRHFVENFFDIRDKQRFRFLHQNCHRRVKALDVYHSSFYPGFFELRLDLVGDVDEVKGRRCFEVNQMIYYFHSDMINV